MRKKWFAALATLAVLACGGPQTLAAPPGAFPQAEALAFPSCYERDLDPDLSGYRISNRAVSIPTGYIVLVRSLSQHTWIAALRPDEQEVGGTQRYQRAFIRYSWWFKPGADLNFRSSTTRSGFGVTEEVYPAHAHAVQLGPMFVRWSIGGRGTGWLYFRPPFASEAAYFEIGLTCAVDVHRIDPDSITWVSSRISAHP